MNMSDGEKLIILMLCEIHDKLNIDGEIETEFLRSAIFGDHTWSLPWKYSGIPFTQQETPEDVKEVVDILSMWSVLEHSYQNLSDSQRAKLAKDVPHHGRNPHFEGFDGNNETEHMSIANFLINDLDRFSEFKGRSMNSHMPVLNTYRRMLSVYEPMRYDMNTGYLSAEQVTAIIKEMIHPSNR